LSRCHQGQNEEREQDRHRRRFFRPFEPSPILELIGIGHAETPCNNGTKKAKPTSSAQHVRRNRQKGAWPRSYKTVVG
jgi:hypothetical protein